MTKRTYKPIEEAPRDGTPIVGVCGGVEMPVVYDDGPVLQGWFYWDEDELSPSFSMAKPQPTEWRDMF
jgi:hypothetical protein